jgi:3,4-dihydroxy 2-butanone 4-phosphate synthase/GTP cyclohydrolase II
VPFSPVKDILEEIRQGKMVIVCDDEDRENEGDLTMAAELVTPEDINFMASYGRGLICMPMRPEMIAKLGIPEIDRHNQPLMETAFTASIDATNGITTGISAADRARTIRVAADSESGPDDLVMPGHVFPLKARPGGVLQRPGQTEAAVDLARLAGFRPAGAICEVMKDDGTMARVPDLEKFSKRHGVKMVTVAQIIEYRRHYDEQVRFNGETRLPTKFGTFRLRTYEAYSDGLAHLALLAGNPEGKDNTLVLVYQSCFVGDVLRSVRCGCGDRLETAMERIQQEGEGIIIYVQHEQRGKGLLDEIEACCVRERPDTVEAKDRRIGAQILKELGLEHIRLMSDGVTREARLRESGSETAERMPH